MYLPRCAESRVRILAGLVSLSTTMLIKSHEEKRSGVTVADDQGIFAELYPQLRRFAAATAPIEIDPDDLVQDALERTLRRHSLATLDAPKAYLCRVILNLASNHRRRFARAREALARLSRNPPEEPFYPSDVSELMRLPASQRAMLFLHEVEGYTYGEIAMLLELSEHAVAKASQRARARLRDELRREERP